VVIAVELVVFVIGMRFGIGGLLIPLLRGHVLLLVAYLRSMWLGEPPEFRIPLKGADHPELYAELKDICQKAAVPLPRKVYLEMGATAWVRMKGYRRGAGTTILGIGYDLLAGLTRAEFAGVLAHEMMHAKLVQRGFRQILTGGVRRAAQLTDSLTAQVAEGRRAKRSENLADFFRRGADTLTRMAARQIAACSRQDEFDADRGAAGICSAGAVRSALLKLKDINRIASRLGLRERMAQMESGEGLSQWLIKELASTFTSVPPETKAEVFNKYSTHPSLHDRLAALSVFGDQSLADSPPAMTLLSNPDEVAVALVNSIQKKAVENEQKDSKKLDRWSRKTRNSTQLQPLQGVGFAVVLFGLIIGGCIMAYSVLIGGAVAVAATVGGVFMYRGGRFKEKLHLPVPDYAIIKTVSASKLEVDAKEVQAIESELRKATLAEKNRQKREDDLVLYSYKALETCDYVRAHVAGRLCLELNNKSIPGALAFAIAAGRLKQHQQVATALQFVIRNTGMRGESPAWGAGWALALLGDWLHAEAFLEQARKRKPANATVLGLLAVTQVRRGKLFSAIASARKATSLQPGDKEYAKLLIDLLLQAGLLREANEQLSQLQTEAATDSELMINMVRLSLMAKHHEVAGQWTDFIAQSASSPHKFVRLGQAYEAARQDQRADEFYQHALTHGHYPEALIGLGRLHLHRQDKDQARAYFMDSLNLNSPVGEESANPVELVVPVFQQLKALQDPVLNCRAWVARMTPQMVPAALANVSLLIHAPTIQEAKQLLGAMIAAMQPGSVPPTPNMVTWKSAPREQQPDGPISPGIQGVIH
jgi:Zn-dependent protease with chaperone function/tetratricopeptide (TPR) repeat protein